MIIKTLKNVDINIPRYRKNTILTKTTVPLRWEYLTRPFVRGEKNKNSQTIPDCKIFSQKKFVNHLKWSLR